MAIREWLGGASCLKVNTVSDTCGSTQHSLSEYISESDDFDYASNRKF